MYTYFIIDEDREVVKIGRSKDPYQRLRTLSVASASRLKLLLVLVGNREKELHQRFAAYRVRSDREWFHTHQDIWNFIRLHKVGDSVCVPLAFYDWMKMQPYRDTPVGDFIGDALGDSSFPKDGSYSEIQWHLRTRSACRAARIACAKAYREFRHHWMRINPGKSLDAAFLYRPRLRGRYKIGPIKIEQNAPVTRVTRRLRFASGLVVYRLPTCFFLLLESKVVTIRLQGYK